MRMGGPPQVLRYQTGMVSTELFRELALGSRTQRRVSLPPTSVDCVCRSSLPEVSQDKVRLFKLESVWNKF